MIRTLTEKELALTDKLTAALAKTFEDVVGEAIKNNDWSHDEVFTATRNSYSRLLIGHFWNVHQLCPEITMEATSQSFCQVLMINAIQADEAVGTKLTDQEKH